MILTHYYHKNDTPFLNLSSLAEKEALSVISTLRDRAGLVYRRFRNPKQYLKQRREAESWVRKEFIKKGGQPVSVYPHYFVIERARWIEATTRKVLPFNFQSQLFSLNRSASPTQIA